MPTPGGGRAKDTTHLTERFRLVWHDETTITFTHEDPTVYIEPHTFTDKFQRVDQGTPFENNDDNRDPATLALGCSASFALAQNNSPQQDLSG
jgi:hypothetical protein